MTWTAVLRRPTARRHIVGSLSAASGACRSGRDPEAQSLVAALEEVEPPRPGPYHFAQALLAGAGEVRARLAELSRELAELNEPPAAP